MGACMTKKKPDSPVKPEKATEQQVCLISNNHFVSVKGEDVD